MSSDSQRHPVEETSRAGRLKERIRPHLKALCRHLLPSGLYDGANWRVGSLLGEPGRSLSVCLEGPWAGRWNDFAEYDDRGDIIDLWMRIKQVTFPEALEGMETWLTSAAPTVGNKYTSDQVAPSFKRYVPAPMSATVERLWDAGRRLLGSDRCIQFALDHWRGWPRGTTAHLCARGLIGLVSELGQRGLRCGFPVDHPTSTGPQRIGFHAREIVPIPGEKPRWIYRPNARHDHQSVPSVPFVLGAEEVPRAELIVVSGMPSPGRQRLGGWSAGRAAW